MYGYSKQLKQDMRELGIPVNDCMDIGTYGRMRCNIRTEEKRTPKTGCIENIDNELKTMGLIRGA